MKFMISGYGSETGTVQKPFRTMRLRSKTELPVRIARKSVSYGSKRNVDAVVVDCRTSKVNQESSDNDVRLYIHDLNRKEAYILASQLIRMVEGDDPEGLAKPPQKSREREWFLWCLFGVFTPGFSDADAVSVLRMIEDDASANAEDAEDQDQKHRLAARAKLLRELLRTYDASVDFSPGLKLVGDFSSAP